ncbi:MAG TPA: hypothetical protein VKT27_00640 [Candidatus Binataceae bacterium]|nr:hypothetical protein [Candidatus Binataceae bacterium]
MESYPVELTDSEFNSLNLVCPKGEKNASIGTRALLTVRTYFRRKDPQCQIKDVRGADLQIVLCDGSVNEIEVKGTDGPDLAWNKLKVSSQRSHDLLVEKRIPIYRVTNVWDGSPSIHVLVCGEDFTLEPELRWAVKPIK